MVSQNSKFVIFSDPDGASEVVIDVKNDETATNIVALTASAVS